MQIEIYFSKYYRPLGSWSALVKSTSFKTYTGEITDPDKYKSKDKYKEGHPDMFYMGISFIIELPAIIRPARLSSGRSSGASGGAGAFLGCLSQGGCSPHFSCFFTCASSQAFEVLLCFLRCGARKIPPGSAVCAESIGAAAQVFY